MLRFIIGRKMKDPEHGFTTSGFETLDIDVPELERALVGGGTGPGCYDIRELAGVEVLPMVAEAAPLPYWPPCNPGCDPEFSGERSANCATLCGPARIAMCEARNDADKAQGVG